jgi:hypothetical protein
VVNRRHLNNRFRVEDNHYIKLDGGSDISVFKHKQAFNVIRHERQSIALGLTVGDNRTLEMHGLFIAQVYLSTNSEDILSQIHYQRWFPNTMFVQYCNKAYIIKVDSPAANSIMMLHELGHSGRKVASFVCYHGSYIRQGYQLIYDRPDFSRPTPPGFAMKLDNEIADSVRTVNMMDASFRTFDMSDVAAAISEADELPIWSTANGEEYFPRENLEVNEAGEIIVTPKHGDSKLLITPEHSLYARLKAIIDSGASVCIFNQPKYF